MSGCLHVSAPASLCTRKSDLQWGALLVQPQPRLLHRGWTALKASLASLGTLPAAALAAIWRQPPTAPAPRR
jgi:hypothetical protein